MRATSTGARTDSVVYLHRMRRAAGQGSLSAWLAWLLPLAASAALAAAPAPLRIQGNITTIELAPVLLAGQWHGAPVSITNGGVPDLARAGGAELATNA